MIMARYDEDIFDNPFFITLEKEYHQLYESATTNRWVICVPKFSAVKDETLTLQDFQDHVLKPDVETDGAFVTVSKQKVEIQQGKISLGSGFKANKVDVLFEETFYNSKDESYRVVCVSGFFNREVSPESSSSDLVDADLSRPPTTYEDCIKLLWGHQGSSKTRDSLDKTLKVFCSEYKRFDGNKENISDLADLVSSHVTRAMQIVLKDQKLVKRVNDNDVYMSSLKIAVETYMMNAVHKHLFSTITACVKSDDALVNKMTRNLAELRLHHLEVRREFEENIPMARKELSRLNQFSTPLGRTFCLKRVVTALTKPLFKKEENEDLVMTSDDLIPLLIYLIIKSQIPNWMANLTYMKYFQMVKVFETEEFSFYLATTEAALDYIKSGNLKELKTSQVYNRQTSGSFTTSKEKFFQYVQYGDESAVSLMLKKPSPTTDDVSSLLCHPLCDCEKCAEITAKNTQNSGAISPSVRDDNLGRTALHIAAFYGQASLIDILAKNGCLIDATDYLGCTPLHLACQKGHQNIILLLVHFGADIGTVENEGNTPLHLCAKNGHEDCVKAILFLDILKNKLNVNAQNDMGDTPLHLAAKWGYDGIVNFLLESEADPRIRNRKRQTPFNVTQNPDIKNELLRIMKDPPPIIVNYPKPPNTLPVTNATSTPDNPSDPSPNQPSSVTSPTKSPHGFQIVDVIPVKSSIQMLDNSSSQMMSPTTPAVASLDDGNYKQIDRLFKAIANKDLPLVKYYFGWVDTPSSPTSGLVDDSNTTSSSSSSSSPDQQAASLCHPLCQCEKCQHIQKHSSINALDINCTNRQGWAAIHKAVTENNIEVLDLLLKKRVYVNAQTRKKVTPLHLACYHNNSEIVEKLVSCGANINIQDQHGEIPLHLASAKACTKIVKYLLQHSSTVNLCNIEGYTPLHHAVCIGSVDVVKLLLDYGAIPDMVTKRQSSPLSLARNQIIIEMLKSKIKSNLCKQHSKSLPVTPVNPVRSENVLDSPSSNVAMVTETSSSIPSNNNVPSTSRSLQDDDKLQRFMSGIDQDNVHKLKQISQDIQSFDKQTKLKRSKTFDHSGITLNSPGLKLSLSIQHFDKDKSLKRTSTFDKSSTFLRSLEHSMSIQHFDTGSLKHVDPVDRGSPLHIYSLVRSFSAYHDDTNTPSFDEHLVEHLVDIDGDIPTVEESSETEASESSELDKDIDNPTNNQTVEEMPIPVASESSELGKNNIDNLTDIQTVEELSKLDASESSELDKDIDNSTNIQTVEEMPIPVASENFEFGQKVIEHSSKVQSVEGVSNDVNEGSKLGHNDSGNFDKIVDNLEEISTENDTDKVGTAFGKVIESDTKEIRESNGVNGGPNLHSKCLDKERTESVSHDYVLVDTDNPVDNIDNNVGIEKHSVDTTQSLTQTKKETEVGSIEKLDSDYVVVGKEC